MLLLKTKDIVQRSQRNNQNHVKYHFFSFHFFLSCGSVSHFHEPMRCKKKNESTRSLPINNETADLRRTHSRAVGLRWNVTPVLPEHYVNDSKSHQSRTSVVWPDPTEVMAVEPNSTNFFFHLHPLRSNYSTDRIGQMVNQLKTGWDLWTTNGSIQTNEQNKLKCCADRIWKWM